jgi:Gluconate 2-dehydrogenase subunit 3
MLKLTLPRAPRRGEPSLPELAWDTDLRARAALTHLTRREFLKALALVLAALAAPWTRVERAVAAARGRYFTPAERKTLVALCARILPKDADPGAAELGAPAYIEQLLTAFDGRRGEPHIFAGGPFSNRNPFPDTRRGVPSRRRPRNAFKHFIPLTRLQELRWRAELFGSAAVPGTDFNDAALGPLMGLRTIYRDGLKKVDDIAQMVGGANFVRLTSDQQDQVLGMLDNSRVLPDARRGTNFHDLLVQHTLEGSFTAPEYGGNRRARGWAFIGLEGDVQPLGFSIYSTDTGSYHERPDHPMSTPNPSDTPISADAASIQAAIVMFTVPFENSSC